MYACEFGDYTENAADDLVITCKDETLNDTTQKTYISSVSKNTYSFYCYYYQFDYNYCMYKCCIMIK